MRDEMIRAHHEFYTTFSPFIVRDKKAVRKLKKTVPHLPYNESWKALTYDLTKRFKQKGFR